MAAASDKDFLNSDFPMYTAALVGIFLLYRVVVSNMRGEPLQPMWLAQGVFPAAFFTFVGALACHEMYLDMTGYPGGLSAWAPSIVTFLVATYITYRGKVAASGGELGIVTIGIVVALACGALHFLLEEVEEVPETYTKAQARKAAREAAKSAKKWRKMVGMGGEPAPAPAPSTSPLLPLEKGSDFISEHMPVVLAVAVFAVLVAGLVNGPNEWPRNLQKGSFPVCFMVLTGVMAWNAFVREARSFEDGSLDDFAPAFIVMLSAMVVANVGAAMQKQSVPRLS